MPTSTYEINYILFQISNTNALQKLYIPYESIPTLNLLTGDKTPISYVRSDKSTTLARVNKNSFKIDSFDKQIKFEHIFETS